jgi:hypothetical protein
MGLQQAYTKKIAKAVPAIKALRYAQVESRIDNELQRKVMRLVPLALDPRATSSSTLKDPSR